MYPIENFAGVWERFEELIDSKEIVSPDEVYHELERGDDSLFKWLKARKGLFRPEEEKVQDAVKEISEKFPEFTEHESELPFADPFVVGLARVNDLEVITHENKANPNKKVKIPDVCEYYGLHRIRFLDLIKEQKWKF